MSRTVPHKETFFQKNMVSSTCTLKWGQRWGQQPVHYTHSWLTRCATLPELPFPFFVQTCSGKWTSRAQFVSGQTLTMGRLSPTSRVNGSQFPESCISLPPMNAYVWGNMYCFAGFFQLYHPLNTAHSTVSRHEENQDVLRQTETQH